MKPSLGPGGLGEDVCWMLSPAGQRAWYRRGQDMGTIRSELARDLF